MSSGLLGDAWAKVSVSTVVRAFKKAGITNEQPSNSNETESEDDERDPGLLDAAIAQLLNSDTEDEEFEGFVDSLNEKVSVLFCVILTITALLII